MSAHQNYLSIESSSIRNLGLQGCELSSSAYSPAAYGRGTTKMPPSLSDNNGAFKLWLAAKSVKRLSGLLLVAAVTALGLTLPAHSQAMVRVNSPAFDDNSRIVEMMNCLLYTSRRWCRRPTGHAIPMSVTANGLGRTRARSRPSISMGCTRTERSSPLA